MSISPIGLLSNSTNSRFKEFAVVFYASTGDFANISYVLLTESVKTSDLGIKRPKDL